MTTPTAVPGSSSVSHSFTPLQMAERADNEVLEEVNRNVLVYGYVPIVKLINTYPADIKCPKKKRIYDKMKATEGIDSKEEIGFVRFRGLPYPLRIRYEGYEVPYVVENTYYRYDEGELDEEKNVVVYVNFADRALFGWFHKEGLALASEDVRALEHPVVCSLRNCLKDIYSYRKGPKNWEKLFDSTSSDHTTLNHGEECGYVLPPISHEKPTYEQFNPVTSDGAGRPTPYLIVGAPRMGELNTKDIYGDAFQRVKMDKVESAVTKKNPSTRTNFIAIEALDQKANPDVNRGPYTINQLRILLRTAMTGFAGARAAFRPKDDKSPWAELTIKTGLWGCGVYGNNPGVICLIQLAAAHFVGYVCDGDTGKIKPAIAAVKYYIGKEKKDEIVNAGLELFRKVWKDSAKSVKDTDTGKENYFVYPEDFLKKVEDELKDPKNDKFHWLE